MLDNSRPDPEAAQHGSPRADGAETEPASPVTPRRFGRRLVMVSVGVATVLMTVGVFFGIKLLDGDDDAAAGPSSEDAQAADEIKRFDFENVTIDNGFGEKQELTNGSYTLPGYEGTNVGTKMIEGPVFADVDEDGDLDAATIYRWTPAAGTPTTIAFIWEWTGRTAEQVTQPIMAGMTGNVTDLAASKNEFTVTMASRSPSPKNETRTERVSVGLQDGYVAQTRPHYGAAARCVIFDDNQKLGTVSNDAAVRIAPDAQAPPIRPDEPVTDVVAVKQELGSQDWNLVRLTGADGAHRCGWVPSSAVKK